MKRRGVKIIFLFNFFTLVLCNIDNDIDLMATGDDILQPPNFVNWPNGSVPFFINPDHFDNEQTLIIMTSLSLIAFKTCLKFAPVMVPPSANEHVLTFENPSGVRKCEIQSHGHAKNEPHVVILGYDCLEAPWMDRIVLRALGLPFEHNRQNRDSYIDVQYENIEQQAIPLFTKDIALPAALRALPYDVNSVMHFGDRDYSKNGHRTIIFKDRDMKQKWDGMSELDLRKLEIIYGPECRERDRQEKIELCHMYPGIPPVDRKKRSVDLETSRSLRVNPDITPPAETNVPKQVQETLIKLDIEAEVQKIVEDAFKVSSKALVNTRAKYCNVSKESLRSSAEPTDVLGIIEVVADYAQGMVDHAVSNLTSFCAESDSIENYQRMQCRGCEKPYRSTKIFKPYPSTKHRPHIVQSTRHIGGKPTPPFDKQEYYRAHDENVEEKHNETATDKSEPHARKKRQVVSEKTVSVSGSREGKRAKKRKSKKDANPRGIFSDEDEQYDTVSSEERGNRKKQLLVTKESEESSDDSEIKETRKPKNNERQGKKKKRPVNSGEQSKQYVTEDERNEEKSGEGQEKKKKKRPANSGEQSKQYFTEDERNEAKSGEGKPAVTKETQDQAKEISEENPVPVGDVPSIIDKNPKTVVLSKENEEFYKQRKWPHGIVRYVIDQNSTNLNIKDLRRRLAMVNASLTVHTCVHIEEIQDKDTGQYEDYLVLDNSPDFVTGRVGGRQIFGTPELLAGGQHRQHTAMMVMAMLGFYFELSRHDRDDYVKVHQRHIRADKLHHFEKIGADATFPLPYDYESATHPPWMFWRKLYKKGISTVATYKDKDPDGRIMRALGQHKKLLSEGDKIKINSVYGVKCMEDDLENVNQPKSDWD